MSNPIFDLIVRIGAWARRETWEADLLMEPPWLLWCGERMSAKTMLPHSIVTTLLAEENERRPL